MILIKGRDNTKRNAGFWFVIYGGGPNAAKVFSFTATLDDGEGEGQSKVN